MYIIVKSILSHPLQFLKAITLMSIVSIPLVTIGLADYLSYQSFQSSLDGTGFEARLNPLDEDYFLNQSEIFLSLNRTELVDSSLGVYLNLVRAPLVVKANTITQNCLLVGLSHFHSTQGVMNNVSVGLLWEDVTSLELSLNDGIEVSDPFNASLVVGAVVNLTSSEIGLINSLISRIGRPSDFLIVLGWIGQIRELALSLFNFHQGETAVDSFYLVGTLCMQNLTHSSVDELVSSVHQAINVVEFVLEEYGEVEFLWTPVNQLENLHVRYASLESRVNLVVWPALAVTALFLYLTIWIMTLSRKRDFGLMMIRGTSRKQISMGIISTDLLIGAIGGLLSIPFGLLISSIMIDINIESQSLSWFEFAIQTPVVLIARAISLAITMVLVSSVFSWFYLKNFDPTDLSSRDYEMSKTQDQSKTHIFGIFIVMMVLLETSLNYPVMSSAIRLMADSPSMNFLVRMFVYAELFLTFTSPIVMGYCIAKLMPFWQKNLSEFLSGSTKLPLLRSNLLIKGFTAAPKRTVFVSGLVLLSFFFSSFLNVLYPTGTLMEQTDNALQVGGDLRIHIQGDVSEIQVVAEGLQAINEVRLVSLCITALISVQPIDGNILPGRLFIVDPGYFEIPSIAAQYMGNTLESNNSILLSQGFSDAIQPTDVLTLYWDYENSSELYVAGCFTYLPGFQDHVFQFQEQDSTSWAFLMTQDCFTRIMPEKKMDDYYLFLDGNGTVEDMQSTVKSVLVSLFAHEPDVRWSIDIGESNPESMGIWTSCVIIISYYFLIVGTLCIALSVVLTVGETRHAILVAKARGASRRLILSSAILLYLVLLLPLVLIGFLMSVAYAYAFQLAPILLDWNIRSGGKYVVLPSGYQIIIPIQLFVSIGVLIVVTVLVIALSTNFVTKKHTINPDLM